MSLTTRLSLFFLAALAVVLLGFSSAIYLLAHSYLERRSADRLQAALNLLTAAAEQEEGGFEWEPHERHLLLDQDLGEGAVAWMVTDGQGNWIAGPKRWRTDFPMPSNAAGVPQSVHRRGQEWLVSQRRLEWRGPTRKPPEKHLVPVVLISAGVPQESARAVSRNLLVALAGISAFTWVAALVAGRWLCRRALRPLTRMARTAREMDATQLGQRLLATTGRDEVADLGAAFNDLLSRLQDAFERQRRFTGDASHQLRTPLTAILGQIEVALRRPRSPDEYLRVLTSVQTQADHLRRIVETLLFLARADAEARLPHLQVVDLNAWLTEHLSGWTEHERFADIRCEEMLNHPALVEAQLPLLGQLVDNLLENACKYSQPGTPIVLRLKMSEGFVALAVEDNGCGILATDLARVFEPFYRSDHARQKGLHGVGLGLPIAKRIATALHGHISVTSQPNVGSCFMLRLPMAG